MESRVLYHNGIITNEKKDDLLRIYEKLYKEIATK